MKSDRIDHCPFFSFDSASPHNCTQVNTRERKEKKRNMTSIKNLMALLAAIPTPGSTPATSAITPRQCGEVNVFYTYGRIKGKHNHGTCSITKLS
jgi:hypothetical protein